MIFESARLVVRQLSMADFDNFYRFNRDPELMQFIRAPQDRTQSLRVLKANISFYQEYPEYGRWAVIERSTLHFVGIGMLRPSEALPGQVEIGYAFFKESQGKGYATEMVEATLDYAFNVLHVPMVVALLHPENDASRKVVMKNDFTRGDDISENGKTMEVFLCKNSRVVETQRLIIIPLNYERLKLYLEGEGRFEKSVLLKNNGRRVSPDVKEMVTRVAQQAVKKARSDHYLFHTFWIVIDKTNRTIVAELGFKGTPEKTGDIEIGYGTIEEERGKGYMTEAVGGMIEWARRRPDVSAVLAETDEQNAASIRVVQKNNFQPIQPKGKMLWWRIAVNSPEVGKSASPEDDL